MNYKTRLIHSTVTKLLQNVIFSKHNQLILIFIYVANDLY